MVEVRLSQVPIELRQRVAEVIVARGRLSGLPALELLMLAVAPKQDPAIVVPAEKAELVARGRLPGGEMPPVWLW